MIKPAALITWPRHIDYPVCRYNLERFKDYFSSIWIAFSEHHRDSDLSAYVRAQLPFCNFVDVVREREDWRDDAVNSMLDKTTNEEYILFLEQDFLIKDTSFFDRVFKDDLPFIFYQERDRIHPAFACVKREWIDKTSKDFAVNPPGDHFYKFFQELPFGVTVEALDVKIKEDYYHMAGLSHNYINFQYEEPFFMPNNFLYYNYKSLKFIKQHPQFQIMQEAIETKYGHPHSHVFLNNFFPNE